MRRISRLLAAALIVSSVLVAGALPAQARKVPETLAHRAAVGSGPVEPGFPIDYIGVTWQGPHEHGHAAVRFRDEGRWGPWTPLEEDGAGAGDGFASGLVAGGDAGAYQVRGLPPGAVNARAVAINTTDGRPVTVGHEPADRAGAATSYVGDVVTRAEWGADEQLRFDSSGREVWPPEYYAVQKLTAHHTATANDDADPAATVRAIYRYHAVDRGFGDIGYQYLIDEQGRVYEGRWSGTDGDPGHDGTGRGVTAAHVGGWNSGNLGVALLGELTKREPAAGARTALEHVLADLASRHGLDPEGSGTFVNPVNGATKTTANISGHRDWVATECPGGSLYQRLPEIRREVARLISSWESEPTTTTTTTSTTTTTTTTTAPADGISLTLSPYKVKGNQRVDLSWDGATATKVDVYRDGSRITTTANDGAYTDAVNRKGNGSYTYKVCEAGTATCSPEATAEFR